MMTVLYDSRGYSHGPYDDDALALYLQRHPEALGWECESRDVDAGEWSGNEDDLVAGLVDM